MPDCPVPVRGCVILPGVKNGTGGAEKGRRGGEMEYAFDSLPAVVQKALMRREMRDGDDVEWALEAPAEGVALATWITIYRQLTVEERERVIAFVMREGIGAFIVRLGLQEE